MKLIQKYVDIDILYKHNTKHVYDSKCINLEKIFNQNFIALQPIGLLST